MDCITVSKKHYEELVAKAVRYDAIMARLGPALSEYEAARSAVTEATYSSPTVPAASLERLMKAEAQIRIAAAIYSSEFV